jgi:hypothetical protein
VIAHLNCTIVAFVDVDGLLGGGVVNYDALVALMVFHNPFSALLTFNPCCLLCFATWIIHAPECVVKLDIKEVA